MENLTQNQIFLSGLKRHTICLVLILKIFILQASNDTLASYVFKLNYLWYSTSLLWDYVDIYDSKIGGKTCINYDTIIICNFWREPTKGRHFLDRYLHQSCSLKISFKSAQRFISNIMKCKKPFKGISDAVITVKIVDISRNIHGGTCDTNHNQK